MRESSNKAIILNIIVFFIFFILSELNAQNLDSSFNRLEKNIIKKIEEKNNWIDKLLPSLFAIIIVFLTAGLTIIQKDNEFKRNLISNWILEFRSKMGELLPYIENLKVLQENFKFYEHSLDINSKRDEYKIYNKNNLLTLKLMYEIILYLDQSLINHKLLILIINDYYQSSIQFKKIETNIDSNEIESLTLDEYLQNLSNYCQELSINIINHKQDTLNSINLLHRINKYFDFQRQ